MAKASSHLAKNVCHRKTIRLSDAQLRAAVNKAASLFSSRPDADKPLVLTGLMGAGKTAVGRRLAKVLKLTFVDSDDEIERAAGLAISGIFERYGETHFRDREREVIGRLLNQGPSVIAIGGGAFVDDHTRELILKKAVAVWIKAHVDTLVERTSRRDVRPLLKTGDSKTVLSTLLEARKDSYAQAHIHCASGPGRLDRTVLRLLHRANKYYFGKRPINRTRRSHAHRPAMPSKTKD